MQPKLSEEGDLNVEHLCVYRVRLPHLSVTRTLALSSGDREHLQLGELVHAVETILRRRDLLAVAPTDRTHSAHTYMQWHTCI